MLEHDSCERHQMICLDTSLLHLRGREGERERDEISHEFVELEYTLCRVYSPQESRALVGVPVIPTTMTFSSHDLDSYVPEGSLLLKRERERERERERVSQSVSQMANLFYEINSTYVPMSVLVVKVNERYINFPFL